MRVGALLAIIVAGVVLAGCSGSGDPGEPEPQDEASFEDLDVQATDTKGILLGVVVDEAIRPIAEAQVTLRMADASVLEQVTDDNGRFAFGDLEPGTYFLVVKHGLYLEAQTSAEVVAGDNEPPVQRIQLQRRFAQDPYMEILPYDGYLACAYSAGVSSTCVNDYTRLAGAVPGCEGGCLKEYNVSQTGGNIREYTTAISPGWQTLVFEMTWVPSLTGTGTELGVTVSYFNRTSTSHWYGNAVQANPLRLQFDVGVPGPNQNLEPELIPAEGMNDLFVFFGAGDLAVNQKFQSFQTNFYYGVPPEGWSFVEGDLPPF